MNLSEILRKHVEILTSSETGRSPGKKGHELSKDYILRQMENIGLSPSGMGEGGFVLKDHIRPKVTRRILGHLMAIGFPIADPGPKEDQGWPIYNLVGVLKSKNPNIEKWHMLIAHYDHLGKKKYGVVHGALDNGAGVATMIEIARECLRLQEEEGKLLPANLMFAFVDREEISTLGHAIIGSTSLCKQIEREWKNLHDFSVIAIDLLGVHMVENSGIDLFALSHENFEGPNSQFVKRILQENNLNGICAPISILEGARFPLSLMPKDTLDRCDYAPYRNRGVPNMFITGGSPWFYHTVEDHVDNVDFDLLAKIFPVILNCLLEENLDQYIQGPMEDKPKLARYSEDLRPSLQQILEGVLESEDFYHLKPREIYKIQRNLNTIKNVDSITKDQTQKIIFDLLLLLHETGKRKVKELHEK